MVAFKKAAYEKVMSGVIFRQPYDRINQIRQVADNLSKYLGLAANNLVALNKAAFSKTAARLDALSPLAILARGYCVVSDRITGKLIRTVEGVKPGDGVEVRAADGIMNCGVLNVEKGPDSVYLQY